MCCGVVWCAQVLMGFVCLFVCSVLLLPSIPPPNHLTTLPLLRSFPPPLPFPSTALSLVAGACPKSYGTNVARLAGLPASVVKRAGAMSATREALYAAGSAEQQQQQQGCGAGAAAEPCAMDVDGAVDGSGSGCGSAAEVQELMGSIRKCLAQLQKSEAGGGGQKEQLVQLQQRAALLCK